MHRGVPCRRWPSELARAYRGVLADHRVFVTRQIDLRSKQRQDISDDLQPSEQVLGMLLIIRDPCRCLDPTEGTGASVGDIFSLRSRNSCLSDQILLSATRVLPMMDVKCTPASSSYRPASPSDSLRLANQEQVRGSCVSFESLGAVGSSS